MITVSENAHRKLRKRERINFLLNKLAMQEDKYSKQITELIEERKSTRAISLAEYKIMEAG